MLEFIKNLPKGVKISQHLRDQAKGYMAINLFGAAYYFPITKEVKQMLGIRVYKGQFYIDDAKVRGVSQSVIGRALQDFVGALYLQVRDNVCAGIESSLMQEMKNSFEELFKKPMNRRIQSEVNGRMLPKQEIKDDLRTAR